MPIWEVEGAKYASVAMVPCNEFYVPCTQFGIIPCPSQWGGGEG